MAVTITRDDYILEFGLRELVDRCDRDGDGQEDPGVFDRAAVSGAAEVYGYVNARPVGVPAPDDALVKRALMDVTRYLLFRTRMDPDVKSNYENTVTMLRSIASGRIGPAGSGGGAAGGDAVIGPTDVQYSAAERTFNSGSLGDY